MIVIEKLTYGDGTPAEPGDLVEWGMNIYILIRMHNNYEWDLLCLTHKDFPWMLCGSSGVARFREHAKKIGRAPDLREIK